MVIELVENKPRALPPGSLTDAQIQLLVRVYAAQVTVTPPSFLTDGNWLLQNNGWVGYIPLGGDIGLSLVPKVPIANVLRMLEVAWDLTRLKLPKGTFDARTLVEFYERMAMIFAQRVSDRCVRGIYRSYVEEKDELVAVRGRVQVSEAVAHPLRVRLPCRYEEFTADVDDNRILAFALQCIRRSGLCMEAHAQPHVRKAYQLIASFAAPNPFTAQACLGRHYNRLNADYRLLHALAHFFIAHTGPTIYTGARQTVPFFVYMPQLFQEFVAAYLRDAIADRHLALHFKTQEPFLLDSVAGVKFQFDGVLRQNTEDGPILGVLDTKYKANGTPSTDDIAQVLAYAHVLGAPDAILIFPAPLANPVNFLNHGISVRSLSYSLDGDLDAAGNTFMCDLLAGQAKPILPNNHTTIPPEPLRGRLYAHSLRA